MKGSTNGGTSCGSVDFEGKTIRYKVDRAHRKYLYICVKQGAVLVNAPLSVSDQWIQDAVFRKGAWILKKIKQTDRPDYVPDQCMEGGISHILGESCTFHFAYAAEKKVSAKYQDSNLTVTLPTSASLSDEKVLASVRKAIEDLYRKTAAAEIERSFQKYIVLTGLKPKSVKIKKMSRSWGRCSGRGEISMNLWLAAYPREAIDSVVLHELCHLKYMNHSREFWTLVEKYMPDYQKVSSILNAKT